MNYLDLQRAKETFQLQSLENERQVLYQARHKFVKKFSPKFIANMSIDDYVYGKGENTLCYKLERTLANLGSINTSECGGRKMKARIRLTHCSGRHI